ncbi:MAG: penicillin-binding protein activator [Pseudomonadota bacterium]
MARLSFFRSPGHQRTQTVGCDGAMEHGSWRFERDLKGVMKGILAAFAVSVLVACSSGPSTQGPDIAEAGGDPPGGADQATDRDRQDGRRRRYDRRDFAKPLHLRGAEPVRVGLLLPFSASTNAAQRAASAMFDAAQLAAFEAADERFLLLPKDTKGTADGAAAAARAALADGAEIILGPLYAPSVNAASEVAAAAGVPVIAFSSDNKLARDGLYLLSFPPEAEVDRVTQYAISSGRNRFGLIAPANTYGERVSTAFSSTISRNGASLIHAERYEQDVDAMRAPARRLAQYSREVVPVELSNGSGNDFNENGFARGYQAVLVPEQGTLLRALAPLFPYYNVDIDRVKLLGVSAWNNPRLTREPALRGGWFAAPEPKISQGFRTRYKSAFGDQPPRVASLSYDATLLAARLARSPRRRGRFSRDAITDPNGYFGADGLFRLRSDGTIERGLAILEIQPGGIKVIDPAPRSFAPSLSF